MKLALFCALLATTPVFAAEANPKAFESIVGTFLQKQNAPIEVAVGVVTPQGTEFFGYSKTGPKPTGNTIYMLGSVQKLFAGVFFGDLIEKGVVKPDQPLQSLLPQGVKAPEFQGTPITLEQMAVFTSAFPDSQNAFTNAIHAAKSPEQIEQAISNFLKNYRLQYKPGTKYLYSDISAAMLANLLSKKTGKPFNQNVEQTIAGPLGLQATGMYFSNANPPNLARGYDGKTGKMCPSPTSNFLSETGSPEIHSTVNDMMKFMQAHLGIAPSPLSGAIKQSMQPRFNLKAPGAQSAFFWSVNNGVSYFKNGLSPRYCYASVVLLNTKEKVGVVVLANTNTGVSQLGEQLLKSIVKP